MSKTQNARLASDTRPARRSLTELTEALSRAVEDGLVVRPAGPVAALRDHPRPLEQTTEGPKRTDVPEQAATPIPVARSEAPNTRAHTSAGSESAAEMVVKIAKDYQNSMLGTIRDGLNAALDNAKDFAETKRGGEAPGNAGVLGAAAVAFRAEALKIMQANVATTLDYARELAGTRTTAEFVELSGTQARKNCELMIKQADALKSFAQAVANKRSGRT